MASRIAYRNWAWETGTTFTASSEATGYPVTNLQSPASWKIWRSAVSTADQWIKIDLGSSRALTGCLLRYALLHAGGTVTWQIVTAAVVGGAAVVVWHLKQKPRNDAQDTNLHLDIGETVTVQMWDAQGQTQVQHRGAQWSAICQQGQAPQPGLHRITEIVGSRLVLEKI